jgi:hypothetical protein
MILVYYIIAYVSAPVSAPVSANSISQKKTGVKPRLVPISLFLDAEDGFEVKPAAPGHLFVSHSPNKLAGFICVMRSMSFRLMPSSIIPAM